MVLNFKRCIKEKMSKAIKEIVAIYKLGKTLPRHSLITIFKSILRFHLDYGDIIYNQRNRGSFGKKIESIQYNVDLAITAAIKEHLKVSCAVN